MERSYLLAAHLRRGEVGSSRGCVALLRRLLRWLQREFPAVPIRLVGDSGFAIPALYQSCERWGIQCSFGIGSNPCAPQKTSAGRNLHDFWCRSGCFLRLFQRTLFGVRALCEADLPCCHFEAFGSVTSAPSLLSSGNCCAMGCSF
jgi:hypothetical protein